MQLNPSVVFSKISRSPPTAHETLLSERSGDGAQQTKPGMTHLFPIVGAGALVALGLSKRSPLGALLAFGGSALAYARLRPGRGHAHAAQGNGKQAVENGAIEATRSITIGRAREELVALLGQSSTLTQILRPLAEVDTRDDGRTRLRLRLPREGLGWTISSTEQQDGSVTWQTEPSERVRFSATFSFSSAPNDWGTVVTLHVSADPGPILAWLGADVLEPVRRGLSEKALRRLKSLAETGEIPTLERNPSARARIPSAAVA